MARFLIAGLGNFPYPTTRHSVGQVVLDSLAGKWNLSLGYQRKHDAWLGTKSIDIPGTGPVEVTLVKPKLLMNISGPAITSVLKTFPLEHRTPRNVILLQDSLSHQSLVVSPKFGGSANGHNGVRSVIASMSNMASQFSTPRPANDEFHRIRLGIGRPTHKAADVADYVLGPLSREELDWWAYGGEGLNKVVVALEHIIKKAAL
ncbi:peptidyl-tRNA hydrolase [Rhizoctonia solani]|nr:peptidyl-tRNA hydrolase [Rhizoctonia solani]